MYSRYLGEEFSPLPQEETQFRSDSGPAAQAQKKEPERVISGISDLLGGILRQFKPGEPDTGDILLTLIILFLFLEGDNWDIVITLGLMLLLGLGGDQETS